MHACRRRLAMERLFCLLILSGCSISLSAAEDSTIELCEAWEGEYAGADATGNHVIALWQFNAADGTLDVSGQGHDLTLHDATIASDGRFGSCLESFPGWPVEDRRHAAVAANAPTLSPHGPFTLEMWICPKPTLTAEYPESFLLDKKYVAHDDYQVILGAATENGQRTLRAILGFGNDSATYYSRPARFEPGTWYHLAFTYDGEGTGRFFVNGAAWGNSTHPGRKSISPGGHPLSIGDRIGSYYHGFPGYMDQVRISRGVREFRPVRIELLADRHVFVRMEPPVQLPLRVINLQHATISQIKLSISVDGAIMQTTEVGPLEPGKSRTIEQSLDTSLRPGEYRLIAHTSLAEPQAYSAEEEFALRIVPRERDGTFPVLMWGIYGDVSQEIPRLKRIGFTHVLGVGADYHRIWEASEPTPAADDNTVRKTRQSLDDALANGLKLVASLSPGSAMRSRTEFLRVDRSGQPFTSGGDICGLFPQLPPFCYKVGASVANTYGTHPAFGAALLHTEVRDHASPCFHPHDLDAFRSSSGLEVPSEVSSPRGVDYHRLVDFPASHVIPDNHPLYVYYRWYWKTGDGWNVLNTALAQGLRSRHRDDLWTFHDPAVRVASVYGSGGEVDVLSQWTYSYPDPIRIGLATDELLAMAAGANPAQQVMKMTQIIWYRSQTAPAPKTASPDIPYEADWEREQPDAPFITIAPMHLREAFWTKIARPIRGIMYHGWESLVPTDSPGSYRFTHPQTQHELTRLIHQVVQPLGPTLLHVPSITSDVAMLESFASEMFAGRGTYGWGGGWAGDCYHVLLYAHLQPEIVFDETILQKGLEGKRVLVMPDCDVLTAGVAERIKAFQAAGGIIIGDERTCPAVQPDFRIPAYQRTGRAQEDKQELLARAAALREQFNARHEWALDSSDPDVIPYRRRWREVDYIFVVNDRREYGQYVGQHGIVMEDGLPSTATLSLTRDGGHAYDLVEHHRVPCSTNDGVLQIPTQLAPCDGRVYLVVDRPITEVDIAVSQPAAERGQSLTCSISVLDDQAARVPAVLPIQVMILDSAGVEAEGSGFYAAVDGHLELQLDIASNDRFGMWSIEVRDLAAGLSDTTYFRVTGPSPWPPARGKHDENVAQPEQPRG